MYWAIQLLLYYSYIDFGLKHSCQDNSILKIQKLQYFSLDSQRQWVHMDIAVNLPGEYANWKHFYNMLQTSVNCFEEPTSHLSGRGCITSSV